MKLWQIIGQNNTPKADVENVTVCEFCNVHLQSHKTSDDMREFICVAPDQHSKWLTYGKHNEERFYITEPCLKSEQQRCFIWQDNKE